MQFRDALQNYNMTTEERKTAFEALKVKDERSAKEIESQMRKLQRISVSLWRMFRHGLFIFLSLKHIKLNIKMNASILMNDL